jgi:hypothetical protein
MVSHVSETDLSVKRRCFNSKLLEYFLRRELNKEEATKPEPNFKV